MTNGPQPASGSANLNQEAVRHPRPSGDPVPSGDPAPPRAAASSTAGPPRLTARSPIEVFVWVFVTRLVALLMAPRSRPAGARDTASTPGATAASSPPDARRAARAAAGRSGARPVTSGTASPDAGGSSTREHEPAGTTRAAVVTAGTAVVAGTAAFVLGRRRGAR